MFFLLFSSFFVRVLAASSGHKVEELWCKRRFFDIVLIGVLSRKDLELSQSRINKSVAT